MTFNWSDRYSVGVAKVDEHHQDLVRVINEVFELLASHDSARIAEALDQLEAYTSEHFSLEEAYMVETHYPHHTEHCADHAAFIAQLKLLQGSGASKEVIALNAGLFLSDWLQEHLLGADKRLFAHVRRAG